MQKDSKFSRKGALIAFIYGFVVKSYFYQVVVFLLGLAYSINPPVGVQQNKESKYLIMSTTKKTELRYTKLSYRTIILYLACTAIIMALFNGCNEKNSPTGSSINDVDPVEKSSANAISNVKFSIFDATNFRPKPEALYQSGVDFFVVAKAYDMWGKSNGQLSGTTHLPAQAQINKIARHAAAGPNQVAIDIQHWKLTGSDAEVQRSVDRHLKVIEMFRKAEPDLKIGLFRTLPLHQIFKSTKPADSKAYQNWEKQNERLQKLASEVDIFYPTLRTYLDDKEMWVTDAKEQIKMVRKLAGDKPVHVVLWPKYHPYYDGYKNRFIEPGFWQLQLETARKHADGIVLATINSTRWNEAAPWWQTTENFLEEIGKAPELALDVLDRPVVSDAEFKVFDATYYRPKPWGLDNYGLTDIKMAYPPSLWGKTTSELIGTTHMPDKIKLTRIVRNASRQGIKDVSVNIEHWPLDGEEAEVKAAMNRFIQIISWVKEGDPEIQVGFYGLLPIRNVDNSTSHVSSGRYKNWVIQNNNLKKLAQEIDAFYPTLYTYNDDRIKWNKEAKRQIEMARILNKDKPVYVFLWPQYHPFDKDFRDKFIPKSFWRQQLDTARKYADGIVIYMPAKAKWDNSAPWWASTRKFMVDLGKAEWK